MAERLAILFKKHIDGTIDKKEHIELMGLLLEPSLQEQVKVLVEAAFDERSDASLSAAQQEVLLQGIFEQAPIAQVADMQQHKTSQWKRWAIAASILLLAGLSYVFFINRKETRPVAPVAQAKDVEAPKTSKAIIVLSNGRSVSIDSLDTINDGSVMVTKDAAGNIIYTGNENERRYNTLVNPRGSKVVTTTLVDGTKVWLNAESSIKYFASNTSGERRVEITGEAYFEVAKYKDRPFIVKKGETEITVLGTHFNVNAYDDEKKISVALLEGSVRVSRQLEVGNGPLKLQEVIIKPGQQAVVASSAIDVANPDLEEVMAWKNGLFSLKSISIESLMSQVARWYDVDIVYEGRQSIRLSGFVDRNVPLSQVIKLLESNGVHLKQEGKKIIMYK